LIANFIKLIITIAIFYFLFQYIDFDEVVAILAKSHGGFILIAFILQMFSTIMAAYRWRLIMQLLVFEEKVSFYIQSYFKGTFFNQVLPGSIGGDAVRIIELTQMGYDKKDSFYGIFVDRVVGLVGLLVLNVIANNLFYGTFPSWLFQLINFVTIGGILSFIALLNFHRLTFLQDIKYIDIILRLGKRIHTLYQSNLVLLKHISVSVLVHLFSVLTIYALALSIDVKLPPQVFLIAIPPIFLLTIVPISLAGWGVREGAMVGILMLIGAEKEKILVISILYGLLLILSAFPGAYFWVKNKTIKNEQLKKVDK